MLKLLVASLIVILCYAVDKIITIARVEYKNVDEEIKNGKLEMNRTMFVNCDGELINN